MIDFSCLSLMKNFIVAILQQKNVIGIPENELLHGQSLNERDFPLLHLSTNEVSLDSIVLVPLLLLSHSRVSIAIEKIILVERDSQADFAYDGMARSSRPP